MATYNNLSYGSKGSEVQNMQQALIDAGYDLGSTGADGKYGPKTQAAVKKYQADNGLGVDGIAGNQTLGALYTPKNTAPSAAVTDGTGLQNTAPAAPQPAAQQVYDPASDAAYQQAIAALTQAQKTAPTYTNSYEGQLKDIYDKIMNRDKFAYDLNSDMLYNQYKDQYTQLGQMAMKDTMGQAAALTGGYGSSYGQAVGQQQYDAYLQKLNAVVPELYGMAQDQYNSEGEQLYNQYALTGDMADDEYGKYQDDLNNYWKDLGYLTDRADTEYDRGYTDWYNKYQMQQDADSTAYERRQDAYSKLVSLMTTTGYKPSADELKAAGMSESEAKSYTDYYSGTTGDSTGSGSTRSSSGGYNNGRLSSSQIKSLQAALGVTADGKYGPKSKAAAGGLSAEEAYSKYVNGGDVVDNGDLEVNMASVNALGYGPISADMLAELENNGQITSSVENGMIVFKRK